MSDGPDAIDPRRADQPRGQPIVALLTLLGGWIAVRAVLLGAFAPAALPDLVEAGGPGVSAASRPELPVRARVHWRSGPHQPGSDRAMPALPSRPVPVPVRDGPAPDSPGVEGPRIAAGHQMLWLAGLAMVPLPPEAAAAWAAAEPPRRPQAPDQRMSDPRRAARSLAQLPRWSADGWFMWPQGGNGYNHPGAGLRGANLPGGAYGASQAGAVVRYRLAPDSALRPTLYLRATSALDAPRGEELAAGLALRPARTVPVTATAELRATRMGAGRIAIRPAAGLVSEFPPLALPLGLRAEAYVAAGYLAGRAGTPFVDGQARVERSLARLGQVDLRVGGGAWGGAQSGVQRLDLGPAATLALPLGPGGARLSADWRFRMAGNAAPASGPALTLSAGF